jgi:hypothetical protein
MGAMVDQNLCRPQDTDLNINEAGQYEEGSQQRRERGGESEGKSGKADGEQSGSLVSARSSESARSGNGGWNWRDTPKDVAPRQVDEIMPSLNISDIDADAVESEPAHARHGGAADQQWSWTPDADEVSEFIAKNSTAVSLAEARSVASVPQQDAYGNANPEWLELRKHRITGSSVGAILGLDTNCTPHRCLQNDLKALKSTGGKTRRKAPWNAYGTSNEGNARDATQLYLQSKHRVETIERRGLVLSTEEGMGWCGASPDGVIVDRTRTTVLEIKCPWGKNTLVDVPTKPIDLYPRSLMPNSGTLGNHAVAWPMDYYAQVQWAANIGQYDRVMCVAWAPPSLPAVGAGAGAAGDASGNGSSVRVIQETRIETQDGNHVIEVLVMTTKGLIQITDMPRDEVWFAWALPRARAFWENRFVPAFMMHIHEEAVATATMDEQWVRKNAGLLLCANSEHEVIEDTRQGFLCIPEIEGHRGKVEREMGRFSAAVLSGAGRRKRGRVGGVGEGGGDEGGENSDNDHASYGWMSANILPHVPFRGHPHGVSPTALLQYAKNVEHLAGLDDQAWAVAKDAKGGCSIALNFKCTVRSSVGSKKRRTAANVS